MELNLPVRLRDGDPDAFRVLFDEHADGASAATLLTKIASAAERQPAPVVRDSQYEYLKVIDKDLPIGPQLAYGIPAGVPLTKAQWNKLFAKAVAEGKYTTTSTESWSPVSDVCRPGIQRYHGRSVGFTGGGPGVKCPSIGGLNDPTYRLLQTLPANPRALLDLISKTEQRHGPNPAQEAFVTIGDLLRGQFAPGDAEVVVTALGPVPATGSLSPMVTPYSHISRERRPS